MSYRTKLTKSTVVTKSWLIGNFKGHPWFECYGQRCEEMF